MKQHDKLLHFHVFPPLILTLLFFVNASLPIKTVGCANRGLIALPDPSLRISFFGLEFSTCRICQAWHTPCAAQIIPFCF